ncbi:MAG TPA: winged helix DNA-binding domain-containing protein [Candidatus Dormibacteraeota bacterium]|nr:winged helix DNA-binding domain-containing protein [Candidatus Dormibacteraeota bacterium]
MPLTWPQAIGWRLARHHLLDGTPATLVEVASDICGAHAQVGASAELMLGLRVLGMTQLDVREALWEKRTLVKTVGLRGTLHLLPAGEVPLWMAANRLRFPAEERRLARSGIDIDELQAVTRAIGEIVGPEPIGRRELERALEERVGGWTITTTKGWLGSYKNWPMAMGWAAALGLVCYGPGHGGRSTFVRLAAWSGWRDEDAFSGGLFALRRFLHTYGPSTRAEFQRWFALEPSIAQRLFDEAAGDLAEVEVEGSRRWLLRSDVGGPFETAPDSVHLLPHFDAFVVGSHPRDQLIPRRTRVAQAAPGTAAPLAVVLVGGRVAGVWERKPKGKRLLVRVGAEVPLTRLQRASIEAQAERIASILERKCELEFGEVPLRFHL